MAEPRRLRDAGCDTRHDPLSRVRLAGMVVVMLLVATLVFFITRLAPGDPAAVMLGEQATAADIAQLRAVLRAGQAAAACSSPTGWASWRTAISASRSSCSGR